MGAEGGGISARCAAVSGYLLGPWGRCWAQEVRVWLVRWRWKPGVQAKVTFT